jgi:hypothetical protein
MNVFSDGFANILFSKLIPQQLKHIFADGITLTASWVITN